MHVFSKIHPNQSTVLYIAHLLQNESRTKRKRTKRQTNINKPLKSSLYRQFSFLSDPHSIPRCMSRYEADLSSTSICDMHPLIQTQKDRCYLQNHQTELLSEKTSSK